MSFYNLLKDSLEEFDEEVQLDEVDAEAVVDETVDYDESPEAAAEELEASTDELEEEELKLEVLDSTEEELNDLQDSLESMLAAGKGLDVHSNRLMRSQLSAIERRLGLAIVTPATESFESEALALQATEDSLESIKEVISKVAAGAKNVSAIIKEKFGDVFNWISSTAGRLQVRFKGLAKAAGTKTEEGVDVPETIIVKRSANLSIDGEVNPKGVLEFVNTYVKQINDRTPAHMKGAVVSVDNMLDSLGKMSDDKDDYSNVLKDFVELIVSKRNTYESHAQGRKGFLYNVVQLPGNTVLLDGVDEKIGPAVTKGEIAGLIAALTAISAAGAGAGAAAAGAGVKGSAAIAAELGTSGFTGAFIGALPHLLSGLKTLTRRDVRVVKLKDSGKATGKNELKPLSVEEVKSLASDAVKSLDVFKNTNGLIKVVDEEQAKIDKVFQKVVDKFKGADDLTDREANVVIRNLDAIGNGTRRYMMGEIKVARIMNKSALDGLRALAVYSAQSLKVYGKVGKEVEEAAKDDLGSGASED